MRGCNSGWHELGMKGIEGWGGGGELEVYIGVCNTS